MATKFEFDATEFKFSHGRNPAGRGSWAFEVPYVKAGEVHFSPSMTFTEAKAWMKAKLVTMFDRAGENPAFVMVKVLS